jgi:hypothetical protein
MMMTTTTAGAIIAEDGVGTHQHLPRAALTLVLLLLTLSLLALKVVLKVTCLICADACLHSVHKYCQHH